MQVGYTVSGDLRQKYILPMMLMTFVENVFKYGISNHEPAPITVKLLVDGNSLTFCTQDRLFEVPRHVVRTGVGLDNTQQRLAHLYPDRHRLTVRQDDELFTFQLTLQV